MRLRAGEGRRESDQLHERPPRRRPNRRPPRPARAPRRSAPLAAVPLLQSPASHALTPRRHCSGIERGLHADVRARGVVPAGLRAAVGEPRRAAGGLRGEGFLPPAARVPALLDHQELMGEAVGRGRVLPAVQGARRLRHQHYGLGGHGDDGARRAGLWPRRELERSYGEGRGIRSCSSTQEHVAVVKCLLLVEITRSSLGHYISFHGVFLIGVFRIHISCGFFLPAAGFCLSSFSCFNPA